MFNQLHTLLRALPAGLRTAAAVFQLFGVTLAFLRAIRTDVAAGPAEQRCIFTTDAHQPGRSRTDDRALPRQRNTSRKHFDVIFLKALGGAAFAR